MTEELCTWCKQPAFSQGEERRICTGCKRIVAICECHRALGIMDGWRVSARRVWGYDLEGYSHKWGLGNAIELTAIKDHEDPNVGAFHVRQFTIRTSMLTQIVDTLRLWEMVK